jgi:putative transposase
MANHAHEASEIRGDSKAFSEHMRRAHGRFGLGFNKRHRRLGKVAHDRPKTLALQDDDRLKNLMFYIDCNPVRAGIISHPTDIRWKEFSSCRFYCYGEHNSYTDMLTLPDWYLELGDTAEKRQRRYRSMLDKYLIELGMKRDPKNASGLFIGGQLWMLQMRKNLARMLRSRKASGSDPPDST